MTLSSKHATLGTLILCALFGSSAPAAEIGRGLRDTDSVSDPQANYFEVGIGLSSYDGPQIRGQEKNDLRVVPIINGRYQWHGVFVENFAEASDGLVLGYNAYNADAWSLDLMLTSKHSGVDADNNELEGIRPRRDIVAGARLSGYAGDYLWQLQGWHDVSQRHDGFGASALVGRSWQLKNWNLHAVTGAGYRSSKVLDYYYGVSSDQALVSGIGEYSVGGGVQYSAEVGLTYPVSERWVFRSTARYTLLPGGLADSPLLDSNERGAVSLLSSITYVF